VYSYCAKDVSDARHLPRKVRTDFCLTARDRGGDGSRGDRKTALEFASSHPSKIGKGGAATSF